MPHKFNADRRDKIPKQKHRVTNWSEYNESLRQRGDLTVWISDNALEQWTAPRRTTPGGQQQYSDLTIELCLTLGMVFNQPLRQTQGLMHSIANLLGVEIAVPDLPDQIDGPVEKFLADGAYDGKPTVKALRDRFGALIEVTIPPPKNAILGPDAAQNPCIRDHHITEIEAHGRMAWQKSSGYNQRSRIETQMGRLKAVIGPKLKARLLESQKSEAKICVRVLNRMTDLGRPNFQRTA